MHNDRNSLFTHTCMLTHLCQTFCNPVDCSLPGTTVCGIFQARILEWVATSSSRGSSPPRDWTHISLHLLHWQADSLLLSHLGSACARAHTHTHRQIKPFRNLITLLYIYYFIMVDCKGKWFYVKAKFFPKKLNIILTVYVFIFYICVYFLIFLRKAFTGQHWC